MLFNLYPKTKLKDLFGREREFREFRMALELGERLIVIYGMRRTGKTSLLKTCLYELKYRSPPTVCVGFRRSVHHGFDHAPPTALGGC